MARFLSATMASVLSMITWASPPTTGCGIKVNSWSLSSTKEFLLPEKSISILSFFERPSHTISSKLFELIVFPCPIIKFIIP